MTLHDYQERAVEWLSRRKRGLVVAPAGSGKTIIAAAALDRVLQRRTRNRRLKVGWLANTLEQCRQAQAAVFKFPALTQAADFTIACAASETDWTGCDVLVGDEIHHLATAPQWQYQIDRFQGPRWGFTATPPEGIVELQVLMGFFDNERFTITREEVGNRLASARVVLVDDTADGIRETIDAEIEMECARRRRWWRGDEQELWGQVAWQVCVDIGIVNNVPRNDAAIALAKRHASDQTLMLVNKIEHGEALAERIPSARLCFSKMGKKARAASLAAFSAGQCKCIVATSLADEGLDLPCASVLILVSGGRSNARTEQRTGRVLRQFAGKSHGLIYDFTDTHHPLPAKHARLRQELYQRLGYTMTGRITVATNPA